MAEFNVLIEINKTNVVINNGESSITCIPFSKLLRLVYTFTDSTTVFRMSPDIVHIVRTSREDFNNVLEAYKTFLDNIE